MANVVGGGKICGLDFAGLAGRPIYSGETGRTVQRASGALCLIAMS